MASAVVEDGLLFPQLVPMHTSFVQLLDATTQPGEEVKLDPVSADLDHGYFYPEVLVGTVVFG